MKGYGNNFMYHHSASLAVDSMNRANESARARTAVDVCGMCHKLLLSTLSKRYRNKKKMVWKWQGQLTPYRKKLRNEAFENILAIAISHKPQFTKPLDERIMQYIIALQLDGHYIV